MGRTLDSSGDPRGSSVTRSLVRRYFYDLSRDPRAPGRDDLIIPSRRGKNRSSNHMLKKFHKDLTRLEIRLRRQHDLRRTFISLCLGDGARSDILRWVTHSRPRTATIDDYTTLVWNPLCDEVAKLRITLRRPTEVVKTAVANVANSHEPTSEFATGSEFESDLEVLSLRGGRDLKTRPQVQPGEVGEHSGAGFGHLRLIVPAAELPAKASAQGACSIVAAEGTEPIAAALQAAMDGWARSQDRVALRRRLVGLLVLVESGE